MKAEIIYYSATGNTQLMAESIAELLSSQNIDTRLSYVSEAVVDDVKDASIFFLGCPAMGVEELEEYEFRPFFDELKESLSGKPVVLFGSFDWGDESWMQTWIQEVSDAGGQVVGSFTVMLTPDSDSLDAMKEQVSDILKNIT